MKKFVSIILAVCLCCALTVPAAAYSDPTSKDTIQPRFQNINAATYAADIIDGYLCFDAQLQSHSSMALKITVRVSAPGMTARTFTESGTGTYISLYEEILADEDVTYTLTFTYNAGGEIHNEIISV